MQNDIPSTDGRATAVLKRDRHRCQNCFRTASVTDLQVHRIVPRQNGGTDRLSNLCTLCEQCHSAVHSGGL
jgi:5-methylcytosine-specific restriction endonuclease McrA